MGKNINRYLHQVVLSNNIVFKHNKLFISHRGSRCKYLNCSIRLYTVVLQTLFIIKPTYLFCSRTRMHQLVSVINCKTQLNVTYLSLFKFFVVGKLFVLYKRYKIKYFYSTNDVNEKCIS